MRLTPEIAWRGGNGADLRLDPRIVALLREVRAHGTLRAATAALGMSYRNAWALLGAHASALGAPLVSIVPLSGVTGELVLTFAWEITWYQYRVLPEAGQPVRLADRGADMAEIEAAFTEWNATLDESGRVVPNVAR